MEDSEKKKKAVSCIKSVIGNFNSLKTEDYLGIINQLVDFSLSFEEGLRSDLKQKFEILSKNTDFFVSPASSRFHGCQVTGLIRHSLLAVYYAVYQSLCFNVACYEQVWLSALLHDLCKVNNYRPCKKNVKKDGKWIEEDSWETVPELSLIGHGSESVKRIFQYGFGPYFDETMLQAVAFHMGFSDLSKLEEYAYTKARENNPMVLLLESSDAYSASWAKDGF